MKLLQILFLGISLTPLYGAETEIQEKTPRSTVTFDSLIEASENDRFSDNLTTTTANIQKVGQVRLVEWKEELNAHVVTIDTILGVMALDGVVTSSEFCGLEKGLRKYNNTLSAANKDLKFYGLSIPKNKEVEVAWRVFEIHQRNLSGDNRKESVRRFFFNLTGKDVFVKVNISDKIGRVFVSAMLPPIILLDILD